MAGTTYLSFNSKAKDVVRFSDYITPATPEELRAHLPLQNTWVMWEQVAEESLAKMNTQGGNYIDNAKELARFATVQEFWSLWYHIPQPSELLSKRMVREDGDGRQHVVDAVMIFKHGVKPMWEDAANAEGGHFDFRFRPGHVHSAQIDEYWNNLVLGLIGGTVDGGSHITGARLVDKLGNHNPRSCCLRIEVWYSRVDSEEALGAFWRSVASCMAYKLDGSRGIKIRGDNKVHLRHRLSGYEPPQCGGNELENA